ncbi:hypothetical protein EGR_11236 [Echinococcus granulosus]|uniref:Uncharacterized protein n=1 Tax=Echinococcus granulosus TaxID=6210 RepID=W6U6C8_ECHGR|nr:hypothetical protein EGR_11236 [Echinococcus granulosus]EUB53907.1 hypothetical protein EGR_11236 [Echinococcus granulosus]
MIVHFTDHEGANQIGEMGPRLRGMDDLTNM